MRRLLASLMLILAIQGSDAFAAPFETVINVSSWRDTAPSSIGSNTQLNVTGSVSLPERFQAGDPDGTSTNVELNFSGNQAWYIDAFGGSVVNLTDGYILEMVFANAGSTINVSNDAVLFRSLRARAGGTVNVFGGSLNSSLWAYPGGHLSVSGGIIKK